MFNTNPALPNMSRTIRPWFLNTTLEVVNRVKQGADFVEVTEQVFNTKGVVQPTSPKDLKLMPEGAWAWESLTIHTLPSVKMNVNQYVRYDGTLYKIMAKKDWSKYGYIKYLVVEAFTANEVS